MVFFIERRSHSWLIELKSGTEVFLPISASIYTTDYSQWGRIIPGITFTFIPNVCEHLESFWTIFFLIWKLKVELKKCFSRMFIFFYQYLDIEYIFWICPSSCINTKEASRICTLDLNWWRFNKNNDQMQFSPRSQITKTRPRVTTDQNVF